MNEFSKASDVVKTECEICLKEIPLSEAKSMEATDYVMHFCGLKGYEKWRAQYHQQEK